jgi:TPR repeat protein
LNLARTFYQKAADRADPEGMFRVGTMYHRGFPGIPVDIPEAMRFYLLAVKHHYPPAIFAVSYIYFHGLGPFAADRNLALQHAKVGAAMDIVGCLLLNAQILLPGPEADALIARAQVAAFRRQHFEYALRFEELGDIDNAIMLFTWAADHGDHNAAAHLGRIWIEHRPEKKNQGIAKLREAAQHSAKDGNFFLGRFLLQGAFPEARKGEAVAVLSKAASIVDYVNEAQANYWAGMAYLKEGRRPLAAQKFQKARLKGHAEARTELIKLVKEGHLKKDVKLDDLIAEANREDADQANVSLPPNLMTTFMSQ